MATILFLTHKVPDPTDSTVVSTYYLIKELKTLNYNIYLFSASSSKKYSNRMEDELINYCDGIKIVTINHSFYKGFLLLFHPKSILRHLKLKYPVTLLDLYYHPQVERELDKFIKDKKIDVIFTTRGMAVYALRYNNVMKIIQPYDAVSEWHRQISKISDKIVLRFLYRFTTYLTQLYEKIIYPRFDKVLVVTTIDKKILKQLNPKLDIYVLPNGVDTNWFYPSNFEIDKGIYSLVFVSNMCGEPTVSNVLWFYKNIFQKIKKKIPNIKLYLVGRDPAPEIQKLGEDPNVIVTGTVEDVRPYIHNATVVVIPMIAGTGIKNKTLEALSMGKAVVSTSIGVQGIAGMHKKHFIVADTPDQFLYSVISLIYNPKHRKKMEHFARKLIINKYTWSKIAEKLERILDFSGR